MERMIGKKPKDKELSLLFTKDAYNRILELADVTGIVDDDKFCKVLQDALKVYEWIISHQALGNDLAIITEVDKAPLVDGKKTYIIKDSLVNFIQPNQIEKAKDLFNNP